ncbi:uncharacterized protein TNCV_2254381 [Trichonephila clavipes]|nr:uncharacterized protein TNCV_2254381 [Trichonephila clavipes]
MLRSSATQNCVLCGRIRHIRFPGSPGFVSTGSSAGGITHFLRSPIAAVQRERECFVPDGHIYVKVHWCAKIKDEVEKLAYQLNEEVERTERPIRRLSKVMYGSTYADMQLDVMGECLSSIKHVVGVNQYFWQRLHTV